MEKFYRKWVEKGDLVDFEIAVYESDLLIRAEKNLKEESLKILKEVRREVENYIKEDSLFLRTLKPYFPKPYAPKIIREMAKMSRRAKVGPMASVAGAIAEYVGKELSKISPQVIVENGGDIFLISKKERFIKVFTGNPKLKNIIIRVKPEETPLGICTSSGKIGHSLSFGNSDAVVVLSHSAILADAAATSIGNRVISKEDIKEAILWGSKIKGIIGLLVIVEGNFGIWGEIELLSLEKGVRKVAYS